MTLSTIFKSTSTCRVIINKFRTITSCPHSSYTKNTKQNGHGGLLHGPGSNYRRRHRVWHRCFARRFRRYVFFFPLPLIIFIVVYFFLLFFFVKSQISSSVALCIGKERNNALLTHSYSLLFSTTKTKY